MLSFKPYHPWPFPLYKEHGYHFFAFNLKRSVLEGVRNSLLVLCPKQACRSRYTMDSYAGFFLQYIPGFSLIEGAVQNILINVLKTGMFVVQCWSPDGGRY